MKNYFEKTKLLLRLQPMLLFLFLNGNCLAQEGNKSLLPISQEYINAYYSGNSELAGQHMHDSIQWTDLTAKEIGTYVLEVKNKENVLTHIKKMSRDIQSCEYMIDHSFESDVFTVFEGFLNYAWQDYQSKKVYDFNIRAVVILTFDDDKIIKHEDYADFKALGKQFHEQKQ